MKLVSSKNVYEILEIIRDKPELYLTSKSISSLQNFLNGYLLLMPNDINRNDDYPPFDKFKQHILNQKERFIGISNPYSSFFKLNSDGDEERAFEQFFHYLDLF
ncbi:hypothetical protein D7Z94_08820 [Ulvibacterium marinum]|uniref:Uncharacterized protein n=1 Tax=Ulvibacterium marinum TaxID=2419782 RepID=A0A3B0C4X5_9FLAO|nr:hypothetical protein D7Z94_08820 [Ulvibacterium marinum]